MLRSNGSGGNGVGGGGNLYCRILILAVLCVVSALIVSFALLVSGRFAVVVER